ncbi:MAG: hypothetical protein LUQ50_15435 [Methanospirillum sp.]|uniref:hypothetical protein n=1 Tax=Methanospirillum sp. TaxID=45200 RepID=UPI00236C3C15|nr:hypothetical protein [Methanospirillum sp.]MDD1730446.1 hypothetical protein [Methanospirillum sp.]
MLPGLYAPVLPLLYLIQQGPPESSSPWFIPGKSGMILSFSPALPGEGLSTRRRGSCTATVAAHSAPGTREPCTRSSWLE